MSGIIIASRKRRIFALLIDHGIIAFVCAYVAFLIFGLDIESLIFEDSSIPFMAVGMLSAFLFVIKDAFNGMSLGKYFLGIRVYNGSKSDSANDSEVTVAKPLQSMLRNVFLIAWPIECVVMVFSTSKKRVGDYIARTQVQRDGSLSLLKRLPLFILLIFLMSNVFQVSSYSLIENSSAFKVAMAHLKNDGHIEELVGVVERVEVERIGTVQINNGEGHAVLHLLIIGQKNSQPVTLALDKNKGQSWVVRSINMENEISL